MNNPIMQYFEYDHLPEQLQEISKPLCDLANKLDRRLANSPEKEVGMRKLLEAKDAFVRASFEKCS